MNQPKSSDDNQASSPEPGIRQEADNSTFGSGQQAAIGNDNIQIQGNNNWLGNTLNFFFGQQTTPIGNPARPKNERILLAAVKEEVTARLRQSLHNAVLINLGKESQPQQVKRPWDAEIKIGLKPAVPLSDTTTILSVFESEEIAGKLLILGEPGAGKSTTQLELAQELIKQAEEKPDYPVPVLFNLSSWKHDRQSIADWLVAELKSKYGVSTKLGKEWIGNRQLLPLIDGLDELKSQRQELCVQAINQFLASENRPLYLAICSRIEEYNNYATQLQLNGAIFLQPLTNNQICNYLRSIEYIELWSTISSDLDLLELVKIPLILSITVLTSQEISVEEWQHLNSSNDRIQYLLDAYIGRMLTRDINSKAYFKNKHPNPRKTRMWLVWLAQNLQKNFSSEFFIEEMQPDHWLENNVLKTRYHQIYKLSIGLFSGLCMGLSIGLNFWWYYGLISGLIPGLIFGLIFGLNEVRVFGIYNISREILLYKYNIFFEFPKKKISLIIPALIFAFVGLAYALIYGLNVGLFVCLAGLLVTVSVMMFQLSFDSFIEIGINPNQGIWKYLTNAVFLGLIFGLSVGLTFQLLNEMLFRMIYGLSTKPIFLLILGLINVPMIGLIGMVNFGGRTCFQHFTLRLILYFNGYIPWNYARFLDYCTERLFLQRVGGRYRFMHKLLQDHFAKMEFKRN
jgi:DNA polymerase III delta prime subunit